MKERRLFNGLEDYFEHKKDMELYKKEPWTYNFRKMLETLNKNK